MKNPLMKNRITVIVFGLLVIAFGCKKSSKFIPGSQYTAAMGGMRNWIDRETDASCDTNFVAYDSSRSASFAIKIINSTTVSALGYTVYFASWDSINKAILFIHQYPDNPPASGYLYEDYLTYNYASDSVSFEHKARTGGCPGDNTYSIFTSQK